ncbi:MAG: ferritin-like protein [Gammaproteobacteria bacterium]|nr:ferritin-like protein [Gammaproteobacteria bacterium]
MTTKHKDLKTLTKMLEDIANNAEPAEEKVKVSEIVEKEGKKGSRLTELGEDLASRAAVALNKLPIDIPFRTADAISVETPVDKSDDSDGSEEPPEDPLDVLKQAIRQGIRLEFATVPPYLIALWSIIDQTGPVAKSIRAIAHEEMLHVAILCNFLSALGERPNLTGDMVPQYPSRLPAGVHPKLEVELLAYGQDALKTFLTIERPEVAVEIVGEPADTFPSEDKTIGRFYAALLKAFETVQPDLDPSHQVAGPFSWLVLTKADDVREAINLITSQGEGASGVPFNRDPRFLSHYYRFKSMVLAVELIWDEKLKKLTRGKPLQQPSVFTLAAASPTGYGLAVPKQLREANEKFVASFSSMLRLLEESWKDGGHKSFVAALEHMFELTELAQTMMRISRPDGKGYCPAFVYRP